MKTKSLLLLLFFSLPQMILAQHEYDRLDPRQRQIVKISSYTAQGNLSSLNRALHDGLDSGLTINEVKEVLVHLYAYTGFPRSLQALNTLIVVLNERKTKGIIDNVGKTASPIHDNLTRYERGKMVLESLTGQKETGPKTGYAALSPEIEVFLKEHLFADLFTRDILSYVDRELATISALIVLGGVEPMMQSHMRIALNIGVNKEKLNHLVVIIEDEVGKQASISAKNALSVVTRDSIQQRNPLPDLYTKGIRAPGENFTGVVWLQMLVQPVDSLGHSTGLVTFEPGARSAWHKHPGGQVLLVTHGKGYYQERGSPIKIIYKGDVIKCSPGIEHWHGASPDSEMSHVSITSNFQKGSVVWLQKVTDDEYKRFK